MNPRTIQRAASAALGMSFFLAVVWLLGPDACHAQGGQVLSLMHCTLADGQEVTFLKTLGFATFVGSMLASVVAGVVVARWLVTPPR